MVCASTLHFCFAKGFAPMMMVMMVMMVMMMMMMMMIAFIERYFPLSRRLTVKSRVSQLESGE